MSEANDARVIDAEVTSPAELARQAVTEYREPAVPANPFDVEPGTFAVQIQQRGENYRALVDWLIEHMVDGEDVVRVHFVKRAKCSHGGPPHCSVELEPFHWSDPDLSKKGAEKVCGLLGLGTRFLGMEDFKRAALKGLAIEHVIIDCELYAANGAAVSQGTGACSLSEVDSNLNAAMKKACKRAHVDAVKRCAGLSGLATEIKKRLPPVDPDSAARRARMDGAAKRRNGETRYATGERLTTCPIGREHKGKPWSKVPTSFLKWICTDVDDKPDIVEAAAAELKRRREDNGTPAPDDAPPPYSEDEIPY